MTDSNRQVYISYAWGGDSERVVDAIDADLKGRGIVVVRDKRDLGYKGMINAFMQEIGRGHAVVVVISDKYLRSPNCMFELVEIVKNKDARDRIFPVVLQDADIYNPVNRIRYIKHWEDKLKELDEAMRSVSATNLQGMREEIDTYDAIRDHVARLTFMLKDMNTLTPEMHENSNFSMLIASLEQRLRGAAPSAAAQVAAPAPVPVAPVASSPAPAVDPAAYLAEITRRLMKDGYEPLKGERFGPMRFKVAFERIVRGFLGADHFRVVAIEVNPLSRERVAVIDEQLKAYAKDLGSKNNSNNFVTGVILSGSVSDDVKDFVYQIKSPKLGWTDGCISAVVVYSATENDIFYPTELPSDLGSDFEENIKKHLAT
jgi:hypothetical protein